MNIVYISITFTRVFAFKNPIDQKNYYIADENSITHFLATVGYAAR